MTSPIERTYTERIAKASRIGSQLYSAANLALFQVQNRVAQGQAPEPHEVNYVRNLFRESARGNMSHDAFVAYRSQMVGVFVVPLIWADLLNRDILSETESEIVGDRISIGQCGQDLAHIIGDALKRIREQRKRINPRNPSQNQLRRVRRMNGFINEATVIMLGARDGSARTLTLPSLQHEDEFQVDVRLRADGFLYDNGENRGPETKFPYQVKSYPSDLDTHLYDMSIISAHDLGNATNSNDWPNSDPYGFRTAYELVNEVREGIDSKVSSVLDQIWQRISKKITTW